MFTITAHETYQWTIIINRRGVAKVVLQKALSLTFEGLKIYLWLKRQIIFL